jgi:predicted O-linked N-acetylglucosamine transferase (SPINDLY family)
VRANLPSSPGVGQAWTAMRDEQRILDRALALHHQGKIADAARLYRRIINVNPHNLHAIHFLGVAEAAAGNIDRAKALIDRSLQSNPVSLEFVENYAAVLHRAREHDAVIRLCERFYLISSASVALLHAGAAAQLAQGRHSEAIAQLTQLLAQHPDHFPAHFMLGSALAKTKQYDAAIASYDRALALNPQLAEAHLDKGTVYFAQRNHHMALLAYDQALAARPHFADAWLGRCYTLIQLGRCEEALAAADEVLSSRPSAAEAWVGRGNALFELNRLQEASAAYEHAHAALPGSAAAWAGHGNVLVKLGRHVEAASAFERALAADSSFAAAWLGRGILSLTLGRHEVAATDVDKALELDPQLASAWRARGQLCYLRKHYDEALESWGKSLHINPDQPDIAAACQRVRMHLCDWADYDQACASIRSSVRDGEIVAPFLFIAVASTSDEQLHCAQHWVEHSFRSVRGPLWRGERYDHDRIRIAYLSADFHDHATSQLLVGVLEHHDRSRFEISGISVGPDDNSSLRRRIEAAFERFIDTRSQGDDQIADLVRTLEVDILIDLKGYSQDARTGVLAMRPAPIQAHYLGFPGTLGASFVDYIIADRTVIPEEHAANYAEKIVLLPNSYQANDRRRSAGIIQRRADHGLPGDAFVFCCFNDNYKITPHVFDSWMRILLEVENSVLWLYEDSPAAARNLRREAAARGLAAERLLFAGRLPHAEHLARYRCADLFLDTLPYGAHTTASDALWAGLPVLSLVGESFAGRVGASLLNAIGIPELITTTVRAYESLAVRLAKSPSELAALKAKLADNRLTTPLFDTMQFTRQIESAYIAMTRRLRAGLPPDHIQIDDQGSDPEREPQ